MKIVEILGQHLNLEQLMFTRYQPGHIQLFFVDGNGPTFKGRQADWLWDRITRTNPDKMDQYPRETSDEVLAT
jgi:hypothetical protein